MYNEELKRKKTSSQSRAPVFPLFRSDKNQETMFFFNFEWVVEAPQSFYRFPRKALFLLCLRTKGRLRRPLIPAVEEYFSVFSFYWKLSK